MTKELTMPGSRVRETHASTVLSIVGRDRMIPVVSQGTGFSMRGPFGWRTVASRFAKGERDTARLADATGYEAGAPAAINIAECGDEVPRRTYLALIGGASHEAFHRLYSQQGALDARTIGAAIAPAIAHPGIDWAKRARLVLDLQNVIEDIYIERLGCEEFPGVRTKLTDLADFIVRQEADSRAKVGDPPATVVQAVFVAWRDLGLGYNTPTLRDNLARLARECPKGLDMLRPGGALHGVFTRSIPDVSTPAAREAAKRALLDGVSLRLALEAVIALEGAASGDQGDGGENGKPQPGDGKPQPGKGKGDGQPQPGDGKGKGEGKGDGQPQPGDGQPQPGEGKGKGKDGEKGEGKGGTPSNGKPDAKGDSNAEGGENGGESGEGENSRDDGEGKGEGAGGGEGTNPATAKDFLDGHSKDGKGALDSNSALEAAAKDERKSDPNDYTSPLPYRPYSTAQDEIAPVRAAKENAKGFEKLKAETRKGTAYLRTRLAVLFRALENSGVEHGVRKGPALSGRMLVDSYCEMQGGAMPTRAYMDRTPAVDMSIAAALVIDESASMKDKLRETCAGAYTLMDALDSVGAKSLAVGFRTKSYDASYYTNDYSGIAGCHRTHAVYYDLFKSWDESFKVAAPRLREIKAAGGTPMADGIEFALRELSARAEGHRILFVLTDGEPDGQHKRVIPTQLQRAADAGVLVVGVGLGRGSEGVTKRFPDSVYADDLTALPALLVKKLEELIRTRATGAKRGRAVRAA